MMPFTPCRWRFNSQNHCYVTLSLVDFGNLFCHSTLNISTFAPDAVPLWNPCGENEKTEPMNGIPFHVGGHGGFPVVINYNGGANIWKVSS